MTDLNETTAPPGFAGSRTGRPRVGIVRAHRKTAALPGVLTSLTRAIEAEIIPRLVMAHGRAVQPLRAPPESSRADAATFAELILGPQCTRASDYVQDCRDRGVTLERIYLDLLVPTASHLRHLWIAHEWDFADITLGLWRLQQLLREYSPAFCAEVAVKSAGLRVLLTPSPGERNDAGHVMFGLTLAGEFFRRDGWETWIEPDAAATAFDETVRSQWFNVVEFFANSDKKLDDLAIKIRMVRRESPNRDIGVVLCGPAFVARPELVLLVGGDAMVSDLSQESLQARSVVDLLTERR